MSDLALQLRDFLLSMPNFPVAKKDFCIDTTAPQKQKSMSLAMSSGEVIEDDIDGWKRIRQPFMLFYKDSFVDSAVKTSAMIDTLNSIGSWLQGQPLPDFTGITVGSLAQLSTASINYADNDTIIYQLACVIEYEPQNA